MKLLRRNTVSFLYYPYTGDETDVNDDGEHTGEFYPEYGDPMDGHGNLSAPSGQTNQTFYGEDIRYTHTLVLDNPNATIRERGVIWCKGIMYDIVAVRPSLNVLSIALRRQTVNNSYDDSGTDEGDDEGEDEGDENENGDENGGEGGEGGEENGGSDLNDGVDDGGNEEGQDGEEP